MKFFMLPFAILVCGFVALGNSASRAQDREGGGGLQGFKPQTQREALLYQTLLELQREVKALRREVQALNPQKRPRDGEGGGARREGEAPPRVDNAQLSKWAGGLGNDWTRVRATGSHIAGTNGESQGIVPFLKVVNDTAVAVNQGGKRKGACCVYLETWHADIQEFLELRDNTGDEAQRTHNLNIANWIPDEFMRRVEADDSRLREQMKMGFLRFQHLLMSSHIKIVVNKR